MPRGALPASAPIALKQKWFIRPRWNNSIESTKQGLLITTVARFKVAKLKDGKLPFPFRIAGTIESPQFSKGTKDQ
jgi:hypothetical protein